MTPPSRGLLDISPVIPVVTISDLAQAMPVARALLSGGIPMIELTLRTPHALEGLSAPSPQRFPTSCSAPDPFSHPSRLTWPSTTAPGSSSALVRARACCITSSGSECRYYPGWPP
jgi:2-dehydro-3-deoxyphosphogluconate aldolase/(4S)-4-hydroxy-2-oxoglutarate aldolase